MKEDNSLKAIKFSTAIIAITIIVLILKTLKTIFIPLMFALFFSFLLSPPYRFMVKKRVPRVVALLLLSIVVVGLVYLLVSLTYFGLLSFVNEFPKYENILQNRFVETLNNLDIPFEAAVSDLGLFLKGIDWGQLWDRFSISRVISSTMGTFTDFIVILLLSLVFLLFILTGKDKMIKALDKTASQDNIGQSGMSFGITKRIESSIISYFYNKSLISLGTAVIAMIFISFFGIDFVLFSGLLLFFLNFIPNFGSIIASLFPILVAVLEFGFGWQSISITIALFVIQFVFGNILEPKLLGDSLDISPIVVLISLIFWGWVWGAVGMLFAIPITSVIHLVLKQIPSAKVISVIISGK